MVQLSRLLQAAVSTLMEFGLFRANWHDSGVPGCDAAWLPASGRLLRNVRNSLPLTRRHTLEDLHPPKYRLGNTEYRNSLTG